MKNIFSLLLAIFGATITYAQKSSLQQQLAGTWTLISVDNIYADGSRVHPYGDNPSGMLFFDEKGNYAIQILRTTRPQIASGDKNNCTPEEYLALVQGSNSHFGKYTIDEKNKTITFKIEKAFFPNWEGTEQKRTYTYADNEIRYVVTHTTQGGKAVIAEVAWRKNTQ
jgi:hypothetical protein